MRTVRVRGVVLGEGMPKICVPVMGKTEAEVCASAQEAIAVHPDLIEWRADFFDQSLDGDGLEKMLRSLRKIIGDLPLLFTFRTCREGGNREIEIEEYVHLNTEAARSGMVDLIDLEIHRERTAVEMLLQTIHQEGVSVIASFHDFSKTPKKKEMMAEIQGMEDSEADIIKLAVMPQNEEDVLRLLEVTNQARAEGVTKPLITMAMGDLGKVSRIAGETFGSAVTFGSASEASAPGQIQAQKLRTVLEILHTDSEKGNLLFLIGFMGTGKSSVARRIHERTGIELIEMDETIEKKENRSISQIFTEEGESYFRELETNLLRELRIRKQKPAVVSCGGGVVLNPENVKIMQTCGKIVLLTAKPETVYRRVGKSKDRPNLKNRRSVQEIESLMEERKSAYQAAANCAIATDHRSVAQISGQIIAEFLSESGEVDG